MRDLEGTRASGSFLVGDRWIAGELDCKGAETSLHLHDDKFFRPADAAGGVVKGLLADRTSVTLVGCLLAPIPGQGVSSGRPYFFTDAFVHYVIVGDRHIEPEVACIARVHIETDDAHRIFNDFDAFGTVFTEESRDLAVKLIEAQAKTLGRQVPLGERPQVMYFTGKSEIIRFDTALGEIAASHRITQTVGTVRGAQFKNSVAISLTPSAPKTFDEAIENTLVLLRFMAIAAGREQNLSRFIIETLDPEARQGGPAAPLVVHWSMKPIRKGEQQETPHPADLPLDPIHRPDEFKKVTADWLARDNDWLMARTRLHSAWRRGRHYTSDRLIAAANMFDLLPDSAAPDKSPLSAELKAAKEQMRKLLKSLPESLERQSLSDAVGRLGNSSLKHKIRHRLSFVPQEIHDRLPDLKMVLEKAVDCRNFFVHGGKPKLDYNNNQTVTFFTDTLEFTFVVSDLAQAGWIPHWKGHALGQSHPFLLFCQTYHEQLAELKSLLPKVAA